MKDHTQNQSIERILTPTTLMYLAIPNLIFFFGYLKLGWSILFAASLIVAIYLGIKPFLLFQSKLSKKAFIILFLALIISLISGFGGMGNQSEDYPKHNAILKDLVEKSWPVNYSSQNEDYRENYSAKYYPDPGYLVYNIAYYLPAALIGKVTSWDGANFASFIWSFMGLALCLLWVLHFTKNNLFLVFSFLFLSGLDWLGWRLLRFEYVDWERHMEWWTDIFQYSSNATLINWVPQHMLPGWLCASIIIYSYKTKNFLSLSTLSIALCILWSPFAVIGSTLLLILHLMKSKNIAIFLNKFRSFDFKIIISTLIFTCPLFFYFSSHNGDLIFTWFWSLYPGNSHWDTFLLFFFLEVGAFSIFLYFLSNTNKRYLTLLNAILLFLPLLFFGKFNDLLMRASIPLLFSFWIIVLNSIQWKKEFRHILFLVVILFGSLNPLSEWSRKINSYVFGPPKINYVKSLPFAVNYSFVPQYLGNKEKFFFKNFAR